MKTPAAPPTPTPGPAAQLTEAQRLLRQGQRAAALSLTKQVLLADRQHVAAWWLAAQAAPNPDEARTALRVVLKLQPDHAAARQALARLDQAAPALQVTPQPEVVPLKPARPPRARKRHRNAVTIVLVGLSLLMLSGGGLLLILNLLGSPVVQQAQDNLGIAPAATATPAPIANGSQIQGSIQDGQTRVYRFSGQANTELFVSVGFTTVSTDADTTGAIELFDPQGYRAARSEVGSTPFELPEIPILETGNFAILQFTLDMTGVWELRLIGRQGRSTGLYVMLMQCYPEANCRAASPAS